MSQKTKLLSIKDGNDFRIELSKIKDKDAIDKIYDDLIEESKGYTISVKEVGLDNVGNILKFFSKMKGIPFNMTAPLVTCYQQLSELGIDDVINYSQIKVIQTMLVQATWDAIPESDAPLSEGEDLLAALKALDPANIALGSIEQKIQIAGVRSAEIEQELATGLATKSAEEDDTTKMIDEAQEELANETE